MILFISAVFVPYILLYSVFKQFSAWFVATLKSVEFILVQNLNTQIRKNMFVRVNALISRSYGIRIGEINNRTDLYAA